MKKIKAFTLIELIFIIVLVGIIAVISIPRIEKNGIVEASDQIAAHIRYTQQLAINDNFVDPTDTTWFKKAWMIQFHNHAKGATGWRYTIFKDNGSGNPNSLNEIAPDPQNPNKHLTSGFAEQGYGRDVINRKLDLQGSYDVVDIQFGGGCAGAQTISFDQKGRPMGPLNTDAEPYDSLIYDDCTITIKNSADDSAIITIRPETGYVTRQFKSRDEKDADKAM